VAAFRGCSEAGRPPPRSGPLTRRTHGAFGAAHRRTKR
jgi:hypothetical protein